MRGDRERLLDILEAIERIEQYAARGQKSYATDELVQVWMLHHLQIIGEAARALSEGFRRQESGIPWASVIGMRNVLVHQYFGIDVEEVWATVQRDVPRLKAEVSAMLLRMPTEDNG